MNFFCQFTVEKCLLLKSDKNGVYRRWRFVTHLKERIPKIRNGTVAMLCIFFGFMLTKFGCACKF